MKEIRTWALDEFAAVATKEGSYDAATIRVGLRSLDSQLPCRWAVIGFRWLKSLWSTGFSLWNQTQTLHVFHIDLCWGGFGGQLIGSPMQGPHVSHLTLPWSPPRSEAIRLGVVVLNSDAADTARLRPGTGVMWNRWNVHPHGLCLQPSQPCSASRWRADVTALRASTPFERLSDLRFGPLNMVFSCLFHSKVRLGSRYSHCNNHTSGWRTSRNREFNT